VIRAVRARLASGWPYLVLLIFFGVGIYQRFSLPNVPFSDPDTWGYLSPALSWLGGRGFAQSAGRDWLYPAFVAFALKTGGAFQVIVIWQKILGCLSVLMVGLAWGAWASLLPLGRVGKYAALLCGLIPLYAQVMNPLVLYFEMQLRPEAVMGFAAFSQLACVAAYCKFRWQLPRAGWATLFGALAILLAYACCQLKPSWLFAFVATILPVFVGIWGGRLHWIPAATGVALSLFLLWLPPRTLLRPDSASRTFLPGTLLTIHAKLIIPSLEKRVARLPDNDPSKAKLREILRTFREEFQKSTREGKTYEKLGYNPDYLFYNSPLFHVIRQNTGDTDEGFRSFCMMSYQDAALGNPFGMAGKIGTEFTYFLFPDLNTFYKRKLDLQGTYQKTIASLQVKTLDPSFGPMVPVYAGYFQDLDRQAGRPAKIDRDSFLRTLMMSLEWAAMPLEIVFLLLLAVCHFWAPLFPLRLAGWVGAVFLAAPAGNALTVCVVHALDISRYRATYGPLLLFALMAVTVFIVTVPMTVFFQRPRPTSKK